MCPVDVIPSEDLPDDVTTPMSRLRKTSSKTMRAVGPDVGSGEVVGASENDGANDGAWETEGDRLGDFDGIIEFDG